MTNIAPIHKYTISIKLNT